MKSGFQPEVKCVAHVAVLFMMHFTATCQKIPIVGDSLSAYGYSVEDLRSDSVFDAFARRMIEHTFQDSIHDSDFASPRFDRDAVMFTASYHQAVGGIPVENTELGITVFTKGRMGPCGGRFARDISVDTHPSLSVEKAVEAAKHEFDRADASIKEGPPRLVIFSKPNWESKEGAGKAKWYLAWKIRLISIGTNSDESPKTYQYFVDAHSGEILDVYNMARD